MPLAVLSRRMFFVLGAKSRDMVAVGQFGASKPPLIRTFLASGSLLLGISRVAVVNLGQNHVSATACGRVGKKPAACCCVEYSTSRVNHVRIPAQSPAFGGIPSSSLNLSLRRGVGDRFSVPFYLWMLVLHQA